MAKLNLAKRALKKLKNFSIAAIGSLALLNATPATAQEEPQWSDEETVRQEEQDNWALEDKIQAHERNKSNSFTLNAGAGYARYTLLGKEMKSGAVMGADLEGEFNLNDKRHMAFSLDFNHAGGLNYAGRVGEGYHTITDADVSVIIEQDFKFKNFTFSAGVGANYDSYWDAEMFEGAKTTRHSHAAGPMLKTEISAKNFDGSLEYALGFGNAGNSVQGNASSMKHKLKLKIEVPFAHAVIGGNAEAEGDVFSIKQVDRSYFNIAAGCFLRQYLKYSDEEKGAVGIELGYEHRWAFEGIDNTEADTVKAGLVLHF